MAHILVFVQHNEGKILKVSRVAVAAAKQLKDKWKKESLLGICLGPEAQAAAGT